jgi:hypothetical protein
MSARSNKSEYLMIEASDMSELVVVQSFQKHYRILTKTKIERPEGTVCFSHLMSILM